MILKLFGKKISSTRAPPHVCRPILTSVSGAFSLSHFWRHADAAECSAVLSSPIQLCRAIPRFHFSRSFAEYRDVALTRLTNHRLYTDYYRLHQLAALTRLTNHRLYIDFYRLHQSAALTRLTNHRLYTDFYRLHQSAALTHNYLTNHRLYTDYYRLHQSAALTHISPTIGYTQISIGCTNRLHSHMSHHKTIGYTQITIGCTNTSHHATIGYTQITIGCINTSHQPSAIHRLLSVAITRLTNHRLYTDYNRLH